VISLAALAASAVLLPGFTPYAAGPGGGTVLRGTFPGDLRPGYVYLPPAYQPTGEYPVLYLLHGMPGSPSEYLYGTDLAGQADAQIDAGTVKPFVAVMPAAGPDRNYNGEWAGPWESELVHRLVPWVDAHLATIPTAAARVLAGLSAGGFGAVDIGLRHPGMFGAIEAWSAYFTPLRDGPFKHASAQVLAANDPTRLVRDEAPVLRRDQTRFFLASGPFHSHWFRPTQTVAFMWELRSLRLPVRYHYYANAKGEWRDQLDTGLTRAFRA
jgi:enterochelin esterase-like enzyme